MNFIKLINWSTLLFGVLLSLFLGGIVEANGGDGLTASGISLTVYLAGTSTLPPAQVIGENYQTLFSRELARKFFPENDFLQPARTFQSEVAGIQDLQNITTLTIPQETNLVSVVKNPRVWPLSMSDSENTTKSIDINYYATKPQRVGWNDARKATYDKVTTTADQHSRTLYRDYANDIAFDWAPSEAARIVETTGAQSAAGPHSGDTTRRLVTRKDMAKVKKLFEKFDMGPGLITSYMDPELAESLRDIDSFVDADKFGTPAQIQAGLFGRIFGIEIWTRSVVPTYSNAGAKKAIGAATASNDRYAAIFFHQDAVIHGHTNLIPMINPDQAAYGGTIANVHMAGGGSHYYTDQIGVVALIQG